LVKAGRRGAARATAAIAIFRSMGNSLDKKTETNAIFSWSPARARALARRQEKGIKRGRWVFDGEGERKFYLNRSQPIEKSRFEKINASKR
jgi:hypothetical protein